MGDLRRENAKLRLILDVARRLAVTNDLDALLSTIVEATCRVLGCERATIFLYDAARDELYSRVAKDAGQIRFAAGRGIAGAVARQRAVINVPDAYADRRFNPEIDRRTGYRTRNVLGFPLESIGGELIGVLQALNRVAGPFRAEDEELARVLSAQAGVALERARLLEEFAEKQRMARDLDIARQIQLGLFPKANPRLEGYEIAGWSRPADQTGGDCYDFMPLADGRWAVLLADATGHGIGAALVIAECRSLLRAMLSVSDDLKRIATGVNRLLAEDLSADRFVTAFIGILDPARHRMDYVAGGQGPLLLVTSRGVENRDATDPPFAVLDDHVFCAPRRLVFRRGTTLALLTDGFYETASPAEELFGEQRVAELIRRHAGLSLEALIEQLYQAARRFSGAAPQADDLTAVLVRRNA